MNLFKKVLFSLSIITLPLIANQTDTLSPVLPETLLPFSIEIEEAAISLPAGLQSYASGVYNGSWVLLAGRTNGLHGFSNVGNNFPPQFQNTVVYVLDPSTGNFLSRPLDESGLSVEVIDALSVVAPQFYQKESTLYLIGGYGINTLTDEMETKNTLTAIDLKKLVKWVKGEQPALLNAIRQVSDPILRVTGGAVFQNDDHNPFLLILGQNFMGLYHDDSNGIYTQQIRPFNVFDNGKNLYVLPDASRVTLPDYRRRDLNIVPILRHNKTGYAAFAGVFTLDTGVWTVPIQITPDGDSSEANPNNPDTFKQAMNHYNCPAFGLYSVKKQDMFVLLPGGISYGYFSGGTFETDPEIPFINQVTTIKIDKQDQFTQYLNGEYPVIISTGPNPGNPFLFGAEAQFFLAADISVFSNGVINLDKLKKPTVIGYIVGGIMSTLANTNGPADSTASPYIFTVTVTPRS